MNIKKSWILFILIISMSILQGCNKDKKDIEGPVVGQNTQIRTKSLENIKEKISKYDFVEILDIKIIGENDEKSIDIYLDVKDEAQISIDEIDKISAELSLIENDYVKDTNIKYMNIVWVLEDEKDNEKHNIYYNYTLGDNYKLDNKFIDDSIENKESKETID